jgi:hypothetical protein
MCKRKELEQIARDLQVQRKLGQISFYLLLCRGRLTNFNWCSDLFLASLHDRF